MISTHVALEYGQRGLQRLARLGLSPLAPQEAREGAEGYSCVGVVKAEGSAADIEGGLERGEGRIVVLPDGEKLTKELHGACVLRAPYAVCAGEKVPALFDDPLGVVQPTLPLCNQAEVT
jgi:hypothetical protein